MISLGHNDRDQHLIVFIMKFLGLRLKTCVDVGKTDFRYTGSFDPFVFVAFV